MRLKVRNVLDFLQEIEKAGIRYVVLRWPQEVPLTEEEAKICNDVDILTDINTVNLPALAAIASRNRGTAACEIYSVSGRGGTFYLGMPYYPPVLAEEILQNRQKYNNCFYIPNPKIAFVSLAFHLVYHKGLFSGIPSGCELLSEKHPKRPYRQLIEQLGEETGAEVEKPYTLLKLYKYLKDHQWGMPYDLLERWPNRSPWHSHLLGLEIELLRPWAQRLPGLLVFFVREKAEKREQSDIVAGELSKKFQILHIETLNKEQISRIIRFVRGGNWLQGKHLELVRPKIAILCYDHNPVPVDSSGGVRNASYPLVRNENVFIKHEIRDILSSDTADDEKECGLHGSDNEFEAQHMLRAIYGKKAETMNAYLEEKIISAQK